MHGSSVRGLAVGCRANSALVTHFNRLSFFLDLPWLEVGGLGASASARGCRFSTLTRHHGILGCGCCFGLHLLPVPPCHLFFSHMLDSSHLFGSLLCCLCPLQSCQVATLWGCRFWRRDSRCIHGGFCIRDRCFCSRGGSFCLCRRLRGTAIRNRLVA